MHGAIPGAQNRRFTEDGDGCAALSRDVILAQELLPPRFWQRDPSASLP